jgi:hypothetical protein
MANRNWLKGAAVVLIAVLALAACSGKGGGGSAPKSGGKASPASDFSYDLSADGQGIKITGYTGKGGAVVIPAKIEDMPVVEIGEVAFKGHNDKDRPINCDAITSIVVPSSVVTIGSSAFGNIDELTKATLPDGLKVIPLGLFASCEKLTTVNLPASLESIGFAAFQFCEELNNLIIPDSISSVKFIGVLGTPENNNNAFIRCGKLPIATRQKIQSWGYKSIF